MSKLRKLFAGLLTAAVMCSSVLPVCAADTTYNDTTSRTGTTTVTVTVTSTYSVSIPATLELSTNSDVTDGYKGTYSVGAKGNIAANKYVTITPASTFTMTGQNNDQLTASASTSQAVTKWTGYSTADTDSTAIGTSDYVTKDGTVTVVLPYADDYKGSLQFTFQLNTKSN
jgi:hypothetical protein